MDVSWQKVREIFDSAVCLPLEERRGFLAGACQNDRVLLTEVETLLYSLESAESFLETPAVVGVLGSPAADRQRFQASHRLGHYEIVKQVGSGGMGEVYLARDEKLDRHVAIKVLSQEIRRQEPNLERFLGEAKAASALNHPNILTIYEFGETPDVHFIVSEFIEGETLRARLSEGSLDLSTVLDISIQIAAALAAAHKAHLIHRDIKPENLMIRPDGYVKILDFGLAKLVRNDTSLAGPGADTVRQNETARGVILGTINYMSPEQAKGENVDERTDIFSLGVVMYEMIAGTAPFAGDSSTQTLANLINAPAAPLSRFSSNVPDALSLIVSKMLMKHREDRFQTVSDVHLRLKELKNNRTWPGNDLLTLPEHINQTGFATANRTIDDAVTMAAQQPTATAASSYRWFGPLAAAVLLAIAATFGFMFWPEGSPAAASSISQKRLTTGGGTTRVAMSADGRYTAVVQNAAVILFDHGDGSERVLVPAEAGMRILTLAFQPDGGAIYFGRRSAEGTIVTLYKIPVAGGETTKILENLYGTLAFSPNAKRMAFIRRYPELNEYNLLTADTDGSNITKLASSQLPNRFEGAPAWSPDGKTIAVPAISVEGGFHYTIAKMDASSGAIKFVPGQRWAWMLSVVWMPDSKGAIIAAQAENTVNSQVWRVDTQTGGVSRLTDDSFVYESIAGSADGRSLAAVKVRHNSHVWLTGDPPVQITTGFDKYDGGNGLAWGPNNTVFYHSRASERDAIWQMQADGSAAKQITTDAGGGFAISPDSRLLAFERQNAGSMGLHLLDLTNGSERPLTQNMIASTPAFSGDGETIFFSLYDKKLALYEIPVVGGEAMPVSTEYQAARSPAVSPSGRYLAFAFNRTQTAEIQAGIAVIDAATKQLITIVPIKSGLGSNYEKPTVQWSNDESELFFLQVDLVASVSHLAKVRISDSTITRVTNFPDGRIFNFAVEPGGNRIALARGTIERDASLLKVAGGL